MNRIMQRYLASNFVLPFVVSCLFFVSFLLTFQLFRIVRIVINKGIPFTEVVSLVGHIAISFLPIAIPLSALFATIFCMNRMSEDSEIVAMRSFGLSKNRLFLPFAVLALLIGSVLFNLNRNLIPYSKKVFKNTVIKMTSKGVLSDIQPGQFFVEIPDVLLFADEVENDGKNLSNVYIHVDHDSEERVIMAKKGTIIHQKEVGNISPSIRMFLEDGNITKVEKGTIGNIQKTLFKEYDFPLTSNGIRPGFVTKDSMRSNSDLRKVMRKEKKEIARINKKMKNERRLTKKEKTAYKNLMRSLPKTQLEYFTRLNNPILCFLFILLGFALGIKKGRGKSGNTSLIALLILIFYYVLFFAGVSLARKNTVPAYAVVFVPTILLGLIGGAFYRKLDWNS